MSKKKKPTITFHNPNNEKDSQLIAEDFIFRIAQGAVKEYLLNVGINDRSEDLMSALDVTENKKVVSELE